MSQKKNRRKASGKKVPRKFATRKLEQNQRWETERTPEQLRIDIDKDRERGIEPDPRDLEALRDWEQFVARRGSDPRQEIYFSDGLQDMIRKGEGND